MTFAMSADQASAVAAIETAFRNPCQQVIRMNGAAGTGKTTVASYAIRQRLGLNVIDQRAAEYEDGSWHNLPPSPRAVVGAPTGKAARVLTRKGLPAGTMHGLLYRCVLGDPVEIANTEAILQRLDTLAAQRSLSSTEVLERSNASARLSDLRRPRWTDHPNSLIACSDLLVIDEASMINTAMAASILRHGKKVLLIGDPYQLPPVEGRSVLGDGQPDAILQQVHRQAGGSPILALADKARRGEHIAEGNYGAGILKQSWDAMSPEALLGHDQIICGLRRTKRDWNSYFRQSLGFPSAYPSGRGEKLICTRNDHSVGLINGMFVSAHDVVDPGLGSRFIEARIVTEDGLDLGRLKIWKAAFDDPRLDDSGYTPSDWKEGRTLTHLDWGWCITCHKSQGSEWPRVAVMDESYCFRSDQRRWLYTAITRAQTGLTIYG